MMASLFFIGQLISIPKGAHTIKRVFLIVARSVGHLWVEWPIRNCVPVPGPINSSPYFMSLHC